MDFPGAPDRTLFHRVQTCRRELGVRLQQRPPALPPPIQMCDALSRNVPKQFQTVLGNCNAHSRRNFVKVTPSFPEQCRFVLETLGEVYGYDEQARVRGMSAEERLHFHQESSKPVMEK